MSAAFAVAKASLKEPATATEMSSMSAAFVVATESLKALATAMVTN